MQLMWLKSLMRELKVINDNNTKFYCDKKASINIAHKLVQQEDNIKIQEEMYKIHRKGLHKHMIHET